MLKDKFWIAQGRLGEVRDNATDPQHSACPGRTHRHTQTHSFTGNHRKGQRESTVYIQNLASKPSSKEELGDQSVLWSRRVVRCWDPAPFHAGPGLSPGFLLVRGPAQSVDSIPGLQDACPQLWEAAAGARKHLTVPRSGGTERW